MSERLTLVEARERLQARLWAAGCALDGDCRLAIAGHRVWRALCEQRFHAEQEGHLLSAHDLTEPLRRRLFSVAGLTVDAERFNAWVGSVVPLTSPPSTPFMTAVEAVSFIVWGAFLTTDDIAAIEEDQIKITGSVEVIGQPRNTLRELAEQRLFGAHVDGALTLLGRKAPRFGADPVGEAAPVPKEFFAGDVALRLFNGIYDRSHPDRAMYRDVAVSTAEFSNTFLTPAELARPSGKIARRMTRADTKADEREFKAWAKAEYEKHGSGPSLKEAYEFAREHWLSRDWSRDQYKCLPPELRRSRGGKGLTKYLAKLRATE